MTRLTPDALYSTILLYYCGIYRLIGTLAYRYIEMLLMVGGCVAVLVELRGGLTVLNEETKRSAGLCPRAFMSYGWLLRLLFL